MKMNVKQIIIGGGKCLSFIENMVTRYCFRPLFFFIYRENIWHIYNSYHSSPNKWKKALWNKYMEIHSASISIDAKIQSPLILPHGVSGIFISQSANIGENVVIFQQVTIGANTIEGSKSYGAPTIGNNVYIGAGAKVIGNAKVSDNCRIGANAVVVKDLEANSTIVCSGMTIFHSSEKLDNSFTPYLKL